MMNKNKEQAGLKLLSVFGIFKESLRLITTWPKIFFQITLVSILPPSCIFLLDWSSILQLCDKPVTLGHNQASLPWYNNISGSISKELVPCLVVRAVIYISSIVFSFISTSTIAYAIFFIYTNREITFKKVMCVVPKVWKPFMITYLCRLFASFAYSFVIFVCTMLFITYGKQGNNIFLAIEIILILVGTLYMSISWLLSDVISVTEKISGIEALKKSRELIKGKVGTAFALFLVAFLCELPIILPKIHEKLVEGGVVIKVGESIYYKLLSVVWSSLVSLFVLVTKSVFYFVCKSYHHEEINNDDDKSIMSDQFDENLGDYVSLKAEII